LSMLPSAGCDGEHRARIIAAAIVGNMSALNALDFDITDLPSGEA
jgi:hypothetical protein